MTFETTRRPVVIRPADRSGTPFGSSGRGRLRAYTQWPNESGFALVDGTHQPGEPRIRDHVHSRHDETFVVMEGTYRVRVDSETVTVGQGDIVFVPRGTAHTFRNSGESPGRVLNFISPADGVELLRELADAASAGLTESELIEIHTRHDAVLLSPLPDWST